VVHGTFWQGRPAMRHDKELCTEPVRSCSSSCCSPPSGANRRP
jgi:hypothetical protein